MQNTIDFDVTVQIIRNSELEDATILSSNYTALMASVVDDESRQKFYLLRSEAQTRIKVLSNGINN